MTIEEALLIADGHSSTQDTRYRALSVLSAEVRRLHALLDDADIIAEYRLTSGQRQWVNIDVWLSPGEVIVHMDDWRAKERA